MYNTSIHVCTSIAALRRSEKPRITQASLIAPIPFFIYTLNKCRITQLLLSIHLLILVLNYNFHLIQFKFIRGVSFFFFKRLTCFYIQGVQTRNVSCSLTVMVPTNKSSCWTQVDILDILDLPTGTPLTRISPSIFSFPLFLNVRTFINVDFPAPLINE